MSSLEQSKCPPIGKSTGYLQEKDKFIIDLRCGLISRSINTFQLQRYS